MRSLEGCLGSKIVGQADLVQLRGQSRRLTVCRVKNGIIDDFSNVNLEGGSARVFVDSRSWGFSSSNLLDPKNVEQMLKHAIKLARASSKLKHKKIILEPIKVAKRDETTFVEKPLQDLRTEEIAKIPLEAYRGAKDAGVNVADVKATFVAIEDDKLFLSSEGSHIKQKSTRMMLFVDVLAKRAR